MAAILANLAVSAGTATATYVVHRLLATAENKVRSYGVKPGPNMNVAVLTALHGIHREQGNMALALSKVAEELSYLRKFSQQNVELLEKSQQTLEALSRGTGEVQQALKEELGEEQALREIMVQYHGNNEKIRRVLFYYCGLIDADMPTPFEEGIQEGMKEELKTIIRQPTMDDDGFLIQEKQPIFLSHQKPEEKNGEKHENGGTT